MKITIFGSGVMANITRECVKADDEVIAMIDPTKKIEKVKNFDVIIDFSHHLATKKLLDFALEYKKPVLIATTGHTKEELLLIEEASNEIPILKMSNTSYGIKVMKKIAKELATLLDDYDIEIVEAHHNRKVDAPSGTALTLAKEIKEVRDLEIITNRDKKRLENEIGIHSIRAGSICGEHNIIFAKDDEIIELKHTALSRKIFANGALKMAKELIKKDKGLYQDL